MKNFLSQRLFLIATLVAMSATSDPKLLFSREPVGAGHFESEQRRREAKDAEKKAKKAEAEKQRRLQQYDAERKRIAEALEQYIAGTTHHSGDTRREIEWFLSAPLHRIRELLGLVDQEREDAFINLIRNTPHHCGDDKVEREWYRSKVFTRDSKRIWEVSRLAFQEKIDDSAADFERLIRGTKHHCGISAHEQEWFRQRIREQDFDAIGRVLPVRFHSVSPLIRLFASERTGCQPHERYESPLPEVLERYVPFVPALGHCKEIPGCKEYQDRISRCERPSCPSPRDCNIGDILSRDCPKDSGGCDKDTCERDE